MDRPAIRPLQTATNVVRRAQLACVLGLALAACMPVLYQADVTRFSSLDETSLATDHKSFHIVPLDRQKGSLEFRTYARSIARRLASVGLHEVADPDTADYVVVFDYGVGGHRQLTASAPVYGQTGGGTTYHSGHVTDYRRGMSGTATYSGQSYAPPTYGVVGTRTATVTHYDRYFTLKIYDREKSTPDTQIDVYEGEVKSSGLSPNFATVSECLMDALFDKFFVTGTERFTRDATTCRR